MDSVTKPVFNSNTSTSTGGVSGVNGVGGVSGSNGSTPVVSRSPEMESLIQERKQRQEIGACWKRKSRTSGNEFLKIRFNRTQLVELVNSSTLETDSVEFVAFPNNTEGNDRRPCYRIFESIE